MQKKIHITIYIIRQTLSARQSDLYWVFQNEDPSTDWTHSKWTSCDFVHKLLRKKKMGPISKIKNPSSRIELKNLITFFACPCLSSFVVSKTSTFAAYRLSLIGVTMLAHALCAYIQNYFCVLHLAAKCNFQVHKMQTTIEHLVAFLCCAFVVTVGYFIHK